MEKYDLCVIGGGPSGYAAAMRAVDFDKSVLLVERDRIGGAGIYDGALSSKTFWEISKEFASFSKKMSHYGLEEPVVHFHNVLNEVNDAVSERSNQLEEHLRLVIQQRPESSKHVCLQSRYHLSESIRSLVPERITEGLSFQDFPLDILTAYGQTVFLKR